MGRFWGVVGTVARDRPTARVVTSFLLFVIAEVAVWTGMLVYAYDRGGPTAAGLIAVAELVPGIVLAPLMARRADRRSPSLVLVLGYVLQAVAYGSVAVAVAGRAPALVAYAGAIVGSTAVNLTRPALFALLPAVAHDAEQLTASNMLANWADNIGIALAGFVVSGFLGLGRIDLLFAASAAACAAAAALASGVRARGIDAVQERDEVAAGGLLDGMRAAAAEPRARLLVWLLTVHFVVCGAMDVLFVVIALRMLRESQAWVGYLYAAFGIGGVVAGGIAAPLLLRRTPWVIGTGVAAVGVGLTAVAFTRSPLLVLACMFVAGAGRAVVHLTGQTVLQRVVRAEVVGRVFGVVESGSNVGLAVGSALVPLLLNAGDGVTLVAIAALLPAAALLGGRTLRRLDQGRIVPVTEIALLRSLHHFATLPAPTLENLAVRLQRIHLRAGEVLIREGDAGDRFYVIADGELAVSVGGVDRAPRRRGEGVGEIALLRRSPRTATVTALGDVTVLALDGDEFLSTVSGHPATARRVAAVAEGHLARDTPPEPGPAGGRGVLS